MTEKAISINTLSDFTEQEVFDRVAVHLLTQKAQSRLTVWEVEAFVDDIEAPFTGSCAYRGDGGRMCAAGILIADSEYKKEFEGEYWTGVLTKMGLKPEDTNHTALICLLQGVHDTYKPVAWHNELVEVANKRSLSTSAIDQYA